MRGYSVLWIPGIDHAGIATHVMVEKNLQKKTGLKRQDIGREKFVQLILEWKASKANKIVNQLKQLGTSVDWSKFTYTLDSVSFSRIFVIKIIFIINIIVFDRNSQQLLRMR